MHPAARAPRALLGCRRLSSEAGVHRVGDFARAGLGLTSSPVGLLQSALEQIQVSSGLPWWQLVAATAFAMRLASLPFTVRLQQHAAAVVRIQPQLSLLSQQLVLARRAKDDAAMVALNAEIVSLFQRNKTSPVAQLKYLALQAPLFIVPIVAVRQMAMSGVASFSTGGALWFCDLTAVDAWHVLPIANSFLFLASFEVNRLLMGTNPPYRNIFRALCFFGIPFVWSLPSMMLVYFSASALYTCAQSLAFGAAPVRRALGLPPVVRVELAVAPAQSLSGWWRRLVERKRREASLPHLSNSIRGRVAPLDDFARGQDLQYRLARKAFTPAGRTL